MGEINYGYVPVVTPLGKQIDDSLVAFGLGNQIVKHKQVLFPSIYIFGAIQIVGDPVHKFYLRYSLLNVVLKSLPLPKTPYDTLRLRL